MSFTNYLEDAVLKHVFAGVEYDMPTLYVGLFTKGPSDAGGGTETGGFGYARQAVTMSVSGSAPTETENTNDLEFPAPTGSLGRITHAGVFDALTGGNLLAWATLTDPSDTSVELPQTIETADIFKIEATHLKIRID